MSRAAAGSLGEIDLTHRKPLTPTMIGLLVTALVASPLCAVVSSLLWWLL